MNKEEEQLEIVKKWATEESPRPEEYEALLMAYFIPNYINVLIYGFNFFLILSSNLFLVTMLGKEDHFIQVWGCVICALVLMVPVYALKSGIHHAAYLGLKVHRANYEFNKKRE